MRHLDPDDDKGHRRCDISYVMACRQKEVRQRNIEENEENACDESHERRCAQLQEHFLHSEFMVTAGILDDEVRAKERYYQPCQKDQPLDDEVRAKEPEHRGICDIVQHAGRHARFTEECHIDRKADEDGIRNAAGAGEDAAAALRDIQHFGQGAAGEVRHENRGKRKKHVRRCFDQLVMREIRV